VISDKAKALLLAPGKLPEQSPPLRPGDFEAGLGISVGPLMAMAIEVALGDLEELGCLLDPHSDELRIREMTPTDVIPFAGTEGLDHFAFVRTADARASTDARPVCVVQKDDPTTRVIARDLAAFLSLLAFAGVGPIARDASDREYVEWRREMLADPDRGEAFRRASERLLTLPGIVLPARPTAITQAHPDIAFHVEEGPGVLTLSRVRELAGQAKEREAKRVLAALVKAWLDLGDLVNAANWT
jgi:hypothetical protein